MGNYNCEISLNHVLNFAHCGTLFGYVNLMLIKANVF
jgi:hypothetical protein